MKKKIKKYLTPLKIKMALENFVKLIIIYANILCLIALAILTYAKFFEFPEFFTSIILSAKIILLVFLIHFILTVPKFNKLVKTADELYFKERLISAIEFADSKTEASNLQRLDTLEKLKKVRVEKLYKVKFNKNFALSLLIIVVLIIAINYLETDISINNKIAYQDSLAVKKETELLQERLENELLKSALDEETIEALLKDLSKNLQNIDNKEEALKALAMTKNDLKDKLSEDDLAKIENALKEIDQSAKEIAGESMSDYAFNNEYQEAEAKLASQNANANQADFNENTELKENQAGQPNASQGEGSQANENSNGQNASSGAAGENSSDSESTEAGEINHTADCDGSDNGA